MEEDEAGKAVGDLGEVGNLAADLGTEGGPGGNGSGVQETGEEGDWLGSETVDYGDICLNKRRL